MQKLQVFGGRAMKMHPWHAIHAGGAPKIAFVNGAYIVPMFATLDSCSIWWRKYCEKNKEQTAWAFTDQLNTWPHGKGKR